MPNIAILLIQLGTPDSPKKNKVRSYLTQFLNDRRVIDLPWLKRILLVNGIIVPFRTSNSSRIYRTLWRLGNGISPLVRNKLSEKLNDQADVYLSMRYKNPSIPSVLRQMKAKNYRKIIVLPLFPQYASASNGSAIEKVLGEIKKWWVIPSIEVINQFWDNEGYLNSLVENTEKMNIDQYDHVLFSYHGLPESQVTVVRPNHNCTNSQCDKQLTTDNQFCYQATCYATTRKLVEKLRLSEDQYTVCFQSRLDDKWLKPYSDRVIIDLIKRGKRKLLVLSPAFVADCLETLVEIGVEYQHLADQHGGGTITLVPSCNDSDTFVDGIIDLVGMQAQRSTTRSQSVLLEKQ